MKSAKESSSPKAFSRSLSSAELSFFFKFELSFLVLCDTDFFEAFFVGFQHIVYKVRFTVHSLVFRLVDSIRECIVAADEILRRSVHFLCVALTGLVVALYRFLEGHSGSLHFLGGFVQGIIFLRHLICGMFQILVEEFFFFVCFLSLFGDVFRLCVDVCLLGGKSLIGGSHFSSVFGDFCLHSAEYGVYLICRLNAKIVEDLADLFDGIDLEISEKSSYRGDRGVLEFLKRFLRSLV